MDFLRDPVWGFFGVIVALLIGAAAISLTLWLRNRKALTYDVISDVPIVTLRPGETNGIAEDIEIRYKGTTVRDVRLIVVRIWNSGNVPIVPNDYVEPLSLTFRGQLLASDVIDSTPPQLRRDLFAGGGVGPDTATVAFKQVLLNAGDSVSVQAVLTRFKGDVMLEGRIVGVSSIRRWKPPLGTRVSLVSATGVSIVFAVVLTALFDVAVRGTVSQVVGVVSGATAVVAAVVALYYTNRQLRKDLRILQRQRR